MKYILVLIGIIGLVTYIFVGGPKTIRSEAEASMNRSQRVWEQIAFLEGSRREMLTRAKSRMGSYSPVAGVSRSGAYSSGYRQGFSQGYFEGSFLAQNRSPNPLFFAVPNP
jgi:hypothetical protein